MDNKKWMWATVIMALALSLTIYYNLTPVSDISFNKNNPEAKEIYVDSVFGCLPLATKYTEDQWSAYQDLNSKAFGYKLKRCN